MLFRRAVAKTNDVKFAQQLVVDTAITSEEIESFSKLAEVCLRKYGVGTEYAPEIGLACVAAGIGLRYTAAIKAMEVRTETQAPVDSTGRTIPGGVQ